MIALSALSTKDGTKDGYEDSVVCDHAEGLFVGLESFRGLFDASRLAQTKLLTFSIEIACFALFQPVNELLVDKL